MTILDESSQCPREEKGKVLAVARTNLLVSNMLVINTMVSRGCSSAPGWLVFSHSRLLSPMFCLRFKFLKMHPLGFLILTNSQFLIIVMQVIIALGVVFFVFKIPCDGPVPLFVLLCLLQALLPTIPALAPHRYNCASWEKLTLLEPSGVHHLRFISTGEKGNLPLYGESAEFST